MCVALAAQDVEPRNFRLSARNPKGKVINGLGLQAFLSSEGSAKQLDCFGNQWFRVTDADTLNVLANGQIYFFPLAGLDSLDLVFKGAKRFAGIKSSQSEELNLGYGKVSHEDNTYAVSQLNMENVDGYTDLRSYIQGRVAGVYFIGGELIIRGINSLRGSIEALIVVDGTPFASFEDANSMIHPGDVASISVLKDASASIYGSRGANGVVLITTKGAALTK